MLRILPKICTADAQHCYITQAKSLHQIVNLSTRPVQDVNTNIVVRKK